MEELIKYLKEFAESTQAGKASTLMTYADGSTIEITYKKNSNGRTK